MAVSLTIPGCGGTAGWVVFRRHAGTWELVLQRRNGAKLAATGSRITETQNVLRPSDAHCFPTGGTRSRTWHWNGSRFVTGPWRYRSPTPNPSEFYARLATVTIGCGISVQERIACQGIPNTAGGGTPRVQVAQLSSTGEVERCVELSPADNCRFGNLGDQVPDLAAGQSTTIGQFKCTVSSTSVQCVVTATGSGFSMTATDITLVAG